MAYRHIQVEPIAGALGAEISGVDLGQDRSDAVIAELRDAWLQHLVIVLRDQHLSPADQVDLANKLGEPVEYPFVKGLPDFPVITPVVKEAHEKVNFGGLWHTDTTYQQRPPMATLLYAREVPPYGGDTLFANMYLAYESLSDGMRKTLDGLRSYCTGTGSRNSHGGRAREDRYADNPAMKAKLKRPDNVVTEAKDHEGADASWRVAMRRLSRRSLRRIW